MEHKNIITNTKNSDIKKSSDSLIERGLSLATNLNSASVDTNKKVKSYSNKIKELYQVGEYEPIISLAKKIIKIDRSNYIAWWYVNRAIALI